MTTISKTFDFHAAHRLPNHDGKCRNLHGHTYKVDVVIEGNVSEVAGAPNQGMVIDFGVVKDIWKDLEEGLDHKCLLWEKDEILDALKSANGGHGVNLEELGIVVVPQPPTAEFIAKTLFNNFWGRLLQLVGEQEPVVVAFVRVWETPTSWAGYDGRTFGIIQVGQVSPDGELVPDEPEGALPN